MRALPDSPAPRCARSLSRPAFAGRAFWWGGPTGRCATSWLYSSNHNPLGNCINPRSETDHGSDSTWPRFLSSRLVAQLLCRITGTAATPSRGTGDICLHVARATEGRAAPVAARLSPVARDYPSRALSGFFMPPHCDCSIKERHQIASAPSKSHGDVPLNLFTGRGSE